MLVLTGLRVIYLSYMWVLTSLRCKYLFLTGLRVNYLSYRGVPKKKENHPNLTPPFEPVHFQYIKPVHRSQKISNV